MNNLFSEIPLLKGERLVLQQMTIADADALSELVNNPSVYQYLPTFLFEQSTSDLHKVIRLMYDKNVCSSIILGIYMDRSFCGLVELYGFCENTHKISIGYRLLQRFWGLGIATETVSILIDYLHSQTDIDIITATTMTENTASAHVLQKNGFSLVAHDVPEDWGYNEPAIVDKWIRT